MPQTHDIQFLLAAWTFNACRLLFASILVLGALNGPCFVSVSRATPLIMRIYRVFVKPSFIPLVFNEDNSCRFTLSLNKNQPHQEGRAEEQGGFGNVPITQAYFGISLRVGKSPPWVAQHVNTKYIQILFLKRRWDHGSHPT